MTTAVATSLVRGPREFVIGTVNFPQTAAFLSAYGFYPEALPVPDARAAAVLYGVDHRVDQWIFRTIDKVGASIRVVSGANDTGPMVPFECGPHGIDVFTRNVDLTAEIAHKAGGSVAKPVPWTLTPGEPLSEARVVAPGGGWAFYSVQTDHMDPSVLDHEPDRLHSNLVMISWVVAPELMEAERDFWVSKAGFTKVLDEFLAEDEMMRLQLQPRPARMESVHFVGADNEVRVDLLSYPDEPAVHRAEWPMRAGLHSAVLYTDDLGAAIEQLGVAVSEEVTVLETDGVSRAVTGSSPGGIRFELRQKSPGN
jgi:hypothetical protein